MPPDSAEDALLDLDVPECSHRGIIEVADRRVTYNLKQRKTYDWTDLEDGLSER
jgi:hypothetical protein